MTQPTDRLPDLIKRLYRVVGDLEDLFPGRRFTLDGHLIGSIGEVLAAHLFALARSRVDNRLRRTHA